MNRTGTWIPSIDFLEDRTCPSGTGATSAIVGFQPMTSGAVLAIVTQDSGITSGMASAEDPYEWLMMAMTPDDMMRIANEYDQAAKSPVVSGAGQTSSDMNPAMSQPKVAAVASVMTMSDAGAMPPAQMEMAASPLVARSSSSARTGPMEDMAESDSGDESRKKEAGGDPVQSMSMDEGKMLDQIRVLTPEDLELPIDPELAPVPQAPEEPTLETPAG